MQSRKLITFWLMILFFSSCYAPKYLPHANEISTNEFGSFIKINTNNKDLYAGELIAVDHLKIIILDDVSNQPIIIPKYEIASYKVRYALASHYGGFIPLGVLNPFIHGYYSVFTVPFHLLTTVLVTTSGETDFQYTQKNLSYEELKMFARFPQGLPATISLADLK